ncbi:MAG: PH domain-containing protein [Bacillota bacterium]
MSDPKRQHPMMILITFLEQLKGMVVPILLVGGLEFLYGDRSGFSVWYVMVPLIVLALSVLIAVFQWWFYRYDYQDDRLYIKKGVLLKQERTIKRERIQTIHIEAGLIQRIFGLVRVGVETAGGLSETELEIKALEKAKAYALKDTLENGMDFESGNEADGPSDEGYTVSLSRLLAAGLTSGSVFVVMGVTLAFALQFTFLLPDDFFSTLDRMGALFIGVLILLYVAVSWVISVLRYAITYAFYTVKKVNGEFSIQRGLIRQKHLSLKEHRVQTVIFVEGLLRQPFDVGTLQVDVAGGTGYKEQTKTVTHPLIRRTEMDGYFDYAFKDHHFTDTLDPLPKRALRRFILRSALPFVIPGLIAAYFTPYGWWFLVPMAPSILLGVQRYRDGGMKLEERQITLRSRALARTTTFTKKNHIQSLAITQNILQKRRRLATIHIKVLSSPAASTYSLKDVAIDEALRLYDWLKQ